MTNPAELAQSATQRGTFSFAQAVQDRNYPEVDVPVYLDEKLVQRLVDLNAELAEIDFDSSAMDRVPVEVADKYNAARDARDEVLDALRASKYTVHVKGISPERTEELENQSYEIVPKDIEETINPITGQIVKIERPSEDRDAVFSSLLRLEHIQWIEDPAGNRDDSIVNNLEALAATWKRLPLVARVKIDEAITDTTIAVDFYRDLVDEVF